MPILSERSIERMILDVAPKVQQLTGWDPKLDKLNVKIVQRDQFYDLGVRPKYEFLGLDLAVTTPKGQTALRSAKFLLPLLALGLYEPCTSTMLIVAENVGPGTNESSLATTLGHELVHRCQFEHNSAFAQLHHSLNRRAVGSRVYEEDPDEDRHVEAPLQAYMTLVEGDARFVQDQLKAMYYQDAKMRASLLSNILGLALLAAGEGFKQKMLQYTKGAKIVESVYRKEGRNGVNQLYGLNERQLLLRFG